MPACRNVHERGPTHDAAPSPPLPSPPHPQVLSEDASSSVRWLRLDASTLKQQLVGLADNWAGAFTGLLASTAARQLTGLEAELQAHVEALAGKEEGQGAAAAQEGEVGPAAELGAGGHGEEEGRQAALEALEALHGRLEGEREDLAQRVAACQDRYGALVSLQVRPGFGWGVLALCKLCAHSCTCSPFASGAAPALQVSPPTLHPNALLPGCRRACLRRSWCAWMPCRR